MAKILLLETSTALCSVALWENGEITSYRKSEEDRTHASLTAVFVDEILRERGLKIQDCDAVCVSMGPGSYTGLRVGVSTAKGLCFGAKKPLLAVGSLDILVAQAKLEGLVPKDCKYIVPMIDARRMEVYCSVFTVEGDEITETQPHIVTEDSFKNYLNAGKLLFIGDGAEKCKAVIHSENAIFIQCEPKATSMGELAMEEYKIERFKDVAYFEPFYLKDFVITRSKKKLF